MKSIGRVCVFGVLLAAPSAWLTGCGGDDSSPGGTAAACSGGSLGSIPVDQLTTSQQTTVCSSAQSCITSTETSTQGPATQLGCRLAGIEAAAFSGATTDAQLQQACQQTYNACIQGQEDAGTTPGQCDISTVAPSCSVTVNQLFACLNDIDTAEVSGINAALQTIPPCSSLTMATLAGVEDAGTPASAVDSSSIPSCQTVEAMCPGAFGTSSNGDAGTANP